LRIEARQRNHDRTGIGVDRDFIGFADVDQQITTLVDPPRHLLRRQIMHLVIRHAISPGNLCKGREIRPSRRKKQALEVLSRSFEA